MDANYHPDERNGTEDERWRTVFDQIFADLRANHPADEWNLRLVAQLPSAKGLEEEASVNPEPVEEVVDQEVAHRDAAIPVAPADDVGESPSLQPAESADCTSTDDMPEVAERPDPVHVQETDEPAESEEKVAERLDENQSVDAGCEKEDIQSAQSSTDQVEPVQEPLQQAEAGQQVEQGRPVGENNEAEVGEKVEPEREVETVDDIATQQAAEQVPADEQQNTPDQQPEAAEIPQDPPVVPDQIELELPIVAIVAPETEQEPVAEPEAASAQVLVLQTPPDTLDVDNKEPEEAVVSDKQAAEEAAVVPSEESQEQQEAVEHEAHVISITLGQPEAVVETLVKPEEIRDDLEDSQQHDYVNDPFDDPPNQVEEVEVKPLQVEQPLRLGASSPQLAANANGESPSKRGTMGSPTKKSPKQDGEPSRKPEWMRRPLVRKGSVGRFIGRMRETMQSKRFHADRLPVVPPPEPEPPKRPPRRKTLANLDLTRESVTTSDDRSQVESSPPPLPRSPPPDLDNKSATLRSTTSISDRKRKNSVGRFIGRVLSTKHLNESTPAEEAPLMQQEAPQQQSAPSVASATPTTTDKTKKGAVNEVGQLIRRILRSKTPTPDESKGKPVPVRPPPPDRHHTPSEAGSEVKAKREKPIVKRAKVQFECQKCGHQWKSLRGAARFEIVVNPVGEGIRHGEVLVRIYGQQCNRCTANVFEIAEWSADGIKRALTDLRAVVGRQYYPEDVCLPECDERGPRAHQRHLCQACQEGICQSKSSR